MGNIVKWAPWILLRVWCQSCVRSVLFFYIWEYTFFTAQPSNVVSKNFSNVFCMKAPKVSVRGRRARLGNIGIDERPPVPRRQRPCKHVCLFGLCYEMNQRLESTDTRSHPFTFQCSNQTLLKCPTKTNHCRPTPLYHPALLV